MKFFESNNAMGVKRWPFKFSSFWCDANLFHEGFFKKLRERLVKIWNDWKYAG